MQNMGDYVSKCGMTNKGGFCKALYKFDREHSMSQNREHKKSRSISDRLKKNIKYGLKT